MVDEDNTDKLTIDAATLAALGSITIGGLTIDLATPAKRYAFQEYLCTRLSVGFAQFENQLADTYTLEVEVPDDPNSHP